jgi:ubiquinone biosynthesis protein UbiJ
MLRRQMHQDLQRLKEDVGRLLAEEEALMRRELHADVRRMREEVERLRREIEKQGRSVHRDRE